MQKCSHAHWLVLIVNKRTDTCERAGANSLTICKKKIDLRFSCVCLLLTMKFVITSSWSSHCQSSLHMLWWNSWSITGFFLLFLSKSRRGTKRRSWSQTFYVLSYILRTFLYFIFFLPFCCKLFTPVKSCTFHWWSK